MQRPSHTRELNWSRFLPPAFSLVAASLLTTMLALEGGDSASKLFTVFVFTSLFGISYLLLGRMHVAIVAAAGLPILVYVISRIKLQLMGIPFLFFDLVFMLRENFLELLLNDVRILALVIVAIIVVAGIGWALWRMDPPRKRSPRLLLVICIISGVTYAAGAREFHEMTTMELISWDHKVMSFVVSMGRSDVRLSPSSNSAAPRRAVMAEAPSGGAPRELPDIICILEESTFDPRGLLTSTDTVGYLTPFFTPAHGKSGSLRMHTFGGSTWLAEFAFLTGIPHTSFGQNGLYAPFLLEGRIEHSLPLHLHRLGYHSIAIYPNSGAFMNARRFDQSIGFDEFLDSASIMPDAKFDWHTPDADIFAAARAAIERTRRAVGKPLFVFILTINQHGPHFASEQGKPFSSLVDESKVDAAGIGPFGEYLARLKKSAEAVTQFQRAPEVSSRPTIFLHFGDHHPAISRSIQLDKWEKGGEPDALFQTYYAISSIGMTLEPTELDKLAPLDIAFLSTLLIKSSGLPSDEVFDRRSAVAIRCRGRYEGCEDPSLIELHDFLLANQLVRN